MVPLTFVRNTAMHQLPATPADVATDPLGPSDTEYLCMPFASRMGDVTPPVIALEWLTFAVVSELVQNRSP
jgi:hypothetical protein